jgi:Xaa-Pro aminopeptidase
VQVFVGARHDAPDAPKAHDIHEGITVLNKSIYESRRATLLNQLPNDSIALIPAAPSRLRTETAEHAYRQSNDLYYFTGFTEKNALLVLIPGDQPQSILFCEPKDPVRECWEGISIGVEQAPSVLGVTKAFSYKMCSELLSTLLANKTIFANMIALKRLPWLEDYLNAHSITAAEPLNHISNEMRLFKSPEELKLMQRAADISVLAHQAGMSSVHPGMYEYQLAAIYEYVFATEGAQAPAYTSIVGGGKNACVLHYVTNRDRLEKDTLVLVDAAAEYDGYAADITRTYPVSGKFTGPQRDLYNLVLAAQENAITHMKPGSTFKRMQEASVETLTQGLIDLKILKGSLEENIEKKTYREFYMHSAGHWLGLDVHDVGNYHGKNEEPRLFEPNMVMTIEPGLYMSPSDKLDKRWWNIGIRIEDDVCITPQGCDILTKSLVKTVDDIEALMREKPLEYAV